MAKIHAFISQLQKEWHDLFTSGCFFAENEGKSLGPGHKNGKLVYYNTVDKTVYKEVPFTDLAPGQEITDTIENPNDMLSASGGVMLVTFTISMATLRLLRKRRE